MSVALNTKHLSSFISEEEYAAIYPQVEAAHNQLEAKSGPGNDFLGWMYLPRDYDKEEFARIKEAAAKIREDSDVLVVAGIGGSYLGARAVIEAVKGQFHNELENGPKIYFCGNSISPTYLNNIISLCKGKRFSINVISKSGTTTETSLAFRVLRELLEKEMGVEEANKRIYATTDRAKGTLKQLADAQGWPTFVVPDDVGGRYSVLSAVGLLPIAAAGISIDDLMKGAADSMERFSVLSKDNDAYKYAAIRNILYRKGKSIEILECYEPDFTLMNEWYKQLFGESEGKDNKGLFPASCIFSTDLHSMGQFIQEGSRTMFETIVDVKKPAQDLFIDPLEGNFDGLNFLANQNMSVVNRKAMEGTILAHTDGAPILSIECRLLRNGRRSPSPDRRPNPHAQSLPSPPRTRTRSLRRHGPRRSRARRSLLHFPEHQKVRPNQRRLLHQSHQRGKRSPSPGRLFRNRRPHPPKLLRLRQRPRRRPPPPV